MSRFSRTLLLLTLTCPALAQVRQETPKLLLSARSLSLRNGAPGSTPQDASYLPATAFQYLLHAFETWHRYNLQPGDNVDLLGSASLSTTPDHRLNLRLLNRATGSPVWRRSVNLKTSGDPERNLESSIDFLMYQLRSAVNHPQPDPHLIVP